MPHSEPMHGESIADAIRTNYNETGVAVMQAMYSDEYLSLGGTASTDTLARVGAISAGQQVLDIGCGVGGPARHLAATLGCHVTGIDLVDSSIVLARKMANERALSSLTRFEVADATDLPFADAAFDVVFGQDAWCHVPDKPALLAECSRVLRRGGKVVFTDWIRLDDNIDDSMAIALEAALSKSAATHEEYVSMLTEQGFRIQSSEDLSAEFTHAYKDIYTRLSGRREELSARFSERVFDIVTGMNERILSGFEQGKVGGARYVAIKPE